MTVEQVIGLLNELLLTGYDEIFRNKQISGIKLNSCSSIEELKELGMISLDAIQLFKRIQALKGATVTTSSGKVTNPN